MKSLEGKPISLPQRGHLINAKAIDILNLLPRKGVPTPVSAVHAKVVVEYVSEAQYELSRNPSDKNVLRGFQDAVDFQTRVLGHYTGTQLEEHPKVGSVSGVQVTRNRNLVDTPLPCVKCKEHDLACVLAMNSPTMRCQNCRDRHWKCVRPPSKRDEAPTRPTKRVRTADEDDSSTPSNYKHILSSSGWNGLLQARQSFLDSLELLRQEVEPTQSAVFDEVYASARVWQLREDLMFGAH